MLLSLAAAEEDMGGRALLGDVVMTDEEAEREVDSDNIWAVDAANRPSIYNFFATRFARRNREAMKAGQRKRSRLVDYGPVGEMEALKNVCLTTGSSGTSSGSSRGSAGLGQGLGQGAELCFYKYVSVDNLLLGRWFDGDPSPTRPCYQ